MIFYDTGQVSQLLAQVDWEQAGVFCAACIAALGGTRGLERLIRAWRGRKIDTGDENDEAKKALRVCPVHDGLVKLLDERNETIRGELTEIKAALHSGQKAINDSLGTIHRRIDDLLKK